jgi:hypothetical protein
MNFSRGKSNAAAFSSNGAAWCSAMRLKLFDCLMLTIGRAPKRGKCSAETSSRSSMLHKFAPPSVESTNEPSDHCLEQGS